MSGIELIKHIKAKLKERRVQVFVGNILHYIEKMDEEELKKLIAGEDDGV